jgi:hypothetical protein
VIGGIGDKATTSDYTGMQRAAREQRAIGASVYDFNTMVSSAWPSLRPSSADC